MDLLRDIIATEEVLNSLLPVTRLQQSVPAELRNAAIAWSNKVWAAALKLGPIPLSTNELTLGLSLAKRPAFVCGVHRSGTTLIRDILDGHPDLVVLPSEGTFYTNLEFKLSALPADKRMDYLGKEWLRRLANPINQAPYWLMGRSTPEKSNYVNFARYVMSWWPVVDKNNPQWPHQAIVLAYASCCNQLAASAWVDKTPVNERFLKRIWKENPEAKIIQVIRNPVDTLLSRKKMEPSVVLHYALADLKIAFTTAYKQLKLNNPQFLSVRYEEFCREPVIVAHQIASFLQVGFDPSLLQTSVAGIPSRANSSFGHQHVAGDILSVQHPISETLSKTEQQLLAAYLGKLSARLSYPLIPVNYFNKWYIRLKTRLL